MKAVGVRELAAYVSGALDREAAVAALKAISTVTGFRVDAANLETARTFRDADGITEHTVITMRYLISPTS